MRLCRMRIETTWTAYDTLILHKFMAKTRGYLNFSENVTFLWIIIKELEFRFRKTKNNRQILIEKDDIRKWWIDFLDKLTYFRYLNRPIAYLDDTYTRSGHTSPKAWNDNSGQGLFINIAKDNRFIILHARSEEGFNNF